MFYDSLYDIRYMVYDIFWYVYCFLAMAYSIDCALYTIIWHYMQCPLV